MRERLINWSILVLRGIVLLGVSGVFIAIVTLNNSTLLVTGSDIGVTMVRTPLVAQMFALLIMIVSTFVIIYDVFNLKKIHYALIFLFSFMLFTLAMHNFVWNYTDKKVEDIWLLMTVQEIPTVTKSADVSCILGDIWLELEDNSGQKMNVFKGLYPWVLSKKDLLSGCKTESNRKVKVVKKPKRKVKAKVKVNPKTKKPKITKIEINKIEQRKRVLK